MKKQKIKLTKEQILAIERESAMLGVPKLSQRVMLGKFTTFGGFKDLRTL